VIPLRQDGSAKPADQNWPTWNQEETAQTETSNSTPSSNDRITLGDDLGALAGDWGSIRAVWTDSPEPLCDLVDRVTEARRPDRTPLEVALACWAVLVLVPRGAAHLASWLLIHPLRLAIAAVVIAAWLAVR